MTRNYPLQFRNFFLKNLNYGKIWKKKIPEK